MRKKSYVIIAEDSLVKFNDEFSREYVKIYYAQRINLLLRAKILRCRAGRYTFSYRYIYYYFLGKHLSSNVSEDSDVRSLVLHYCEHLYVRDYANTVLFLTHHCNDQWVIDVIWKKLKSIFGDMEPFRFENDTSSLNELVERATQLVFHESEPEKNREEINALKDELEDEVDDDQGQKEIEGEPTVGIELVSLMRTVDILGQVLKNYYGTLKNERKRELMAGVYDGPLRALRSLTETVHRFKEGFLSEIEGVLEKESPQGDDDKRKKFARRVAFEFLAMFAHSFLYKASSAVGSQHLNETSRSLISQRPSIAYKLIALGATLDAANPMPMQEIADLAKLTEGNSFARRLLEIIVLRHLYFFKISIRDKQLVTSTLRIPIKAQRRLEYSGRDHKLMR